MPTQRQIYLFLGGGGESDRELTVFSRIELNQLYIAFPCQWFSISGDATQKESVCMESIAVRIGAPSKGKCTEKNIAFWQINPGESICASPWSIHK